MGTDRPGVLFLWTANSTRSVMAAAFFRRSAGDRFEVAGAGLDPRSIHPLTVRVMREAGFEFGGREPHSVREYLGRKSFRYVVTVCRPPRKKPAQSSGRSPWAGWLSRSSTLPRAAGLRTSGWHGSGWCGTRSKP